MLPLEIKSATWYVYVLRSRKSNYWYTGSTKDLRKRFIQHNENKSTYTNKRGPWELMYYEWCKVEEDARSRELYLKSGMGKRYLNNRLKRFLSLTG